MIITRLLGGLGNQMFQYAAGLALAEAHRTVLKLDVSWFRHNPAYEPHNRYALSCFNITEQFATRREIDDLRGLQLATTERWAASLARRLRLFRIAALHQSGTRWYRQPGHRHDPAFHSLPDESYLEGMFQSEQFFARVADLLRLHFSFRYPAPPAVAAMAERIRSGGPSAFVHFRRGDYLTNPDFAREIGCLDGAYYQEATARLAEQHPGLTLYAFSDDMDWVEANFHPPLPCVFVRATAPWHSYDKIRLMALCDHAILSNSTFAWWGAWLNPSTEKTVIAPDPWFPPASPHDARDLVPDSWTRLPRACIP